MRGAAIIVITHRLTVLEVVDALMVVRCGALDMIGPPAEIYNRLRARSAPALGA